MHQQGIEQIQANIAEQKTRLQLIAQRRADAESVATAATTLAAKQAEVKRTEEKNLHVREQIKEHQTVTSQLACRPQHKLMI